MSKEENLLTLTRTVARRGECVERERKDLKEGTHERAQVCGQTRVSAAHESTSERSERSGRPTDSFSWQIASFT